STHGYFRVSEGGVLVLYVENRFAGLHFGAEGLADFGDESFHFGRNHGGETSFHFRRNKEAAGIVRGLHFLHQNFGFFFRERTHARLGVPGEKEQDEDYGHGGAVRQKFHEASRDMRGGLYAAQYTKRRWGKQPQRPSHELKCGLTARVEA